MMGASFNLTPSHAKLVFPFSLNLKGCKPVCSVPGMQQQSFLAGSWL